MPGVILEIKRPILHKYKYKYEKLFRRILLSYLNSDIEEFDHMTMTNIKLKITGYKAKDSNDLLQTRPHGDFKEKYQDIQNDDGIAEGGAAAGGNAVS